MMLNIDLLHHRLHVYLRHLHRLQQQDIQLNLVLMLLWLAVAWPMVAPGRQAL